MSVLDDIMAHKRDEIAQQQARRSLAGVRAAAEAAPAPLDFVAALRETKGRASTQAPPPAHSPTLPHPALIAEIKRRSPSRGLLASDFDPLRLARIYRENGAACISVLTDAKYFGGSLEDLAGVKGQESAIPLLRKDFICDPYQIYQARAAGADTVLLIVAALLPELLRDLHALARGLGMAALVEVHTAEELETAMTCDPTLVGINNRDLHTFAVSLATTERLCRGLPARVCVVAESGIHNAADVATVAAIPRPDTTGVDAILVGEALVTASDVGAKVRELAQPRENTNEG
jgi:indole-3-glycerol phosphate synthase